MGVEKGRKETCGKVDSRNLDDLVVERLEQVAKRLDATLTDEVPNLTRLLQTSTGSIAQRPAGLLLGLEVRRAENLDERWDDVCVDDGLDLVG